MHMRRGCGTLTYRRNRKKSRKAPVVREVIVSRHRQLFLIFLFVVSQFFFIQSSMFDVRDISVTGESKIPELSVIEAMGLGEQARYWDLSSQVLQSDILEINSLESARVDIDFPGRISVHVTERQPIFTVCSIARTKQPFTVDKEGVIVAAGQAPPGSLQLVLDRDVKVGGRLSHNELEVAIFLREHLSKTLASRLGQVRFDDKGDVTLRVAYRNGKIPVRLGRPEKLGYKLFLLEELLASLKAESAEVVSIDLRFSTPIVRQPYSKPVAPQEPPAE
jgi:cell division septal protein FtsQ